MSTRLNTTLLPIRTLLISARYFRAALCFGAAFVMLAVAVAGGWIRPLDQRLAVAGRFDSPCWALNVSEIVSPLAAGEVCLVYAGALALLCVLHRRPRLGAWVVGLLLVTVAVEFLLKFSLQQSTPQYVLGDVTRLDCVRPAFFTYRLAQVSVPNSFPSGHAARSAYFGLLFVALVGVHWPRLALPSRAALGPLLIALGATRIFTTWHWTSDVIGGLFLGATVACLALGLADGFRWVGPAESDSQKQKETGRGD